MRGTERGTGLLFCLFVANEGLLVEPGCLAGQLERDVRSGWWPGQGYTDTANKTPGALRWV